MSFLLLHRPLFLMISGFLLLAVSSRGQLCQGSLGDPIVNITFGAGSNPGGRLSTTANLQYVTNDCPDDGFYSVRNSSANCFLSTWHNIASDHTGDPGGYFMLINASLQQSEFYIDTVKALCPGTTYEFASWVTNVILPSSCQGNTIRPNLTFRIENLDGSIIKQFNTGNIDPTQTPVWKQYGFFFTTPSGSSNVLLRILNNSTGGCGNDLGIDDITFRPCGASLTPAIVGTSSNTVSVCKGSRDTSVLFTCNVSSGYNNPFLQWQESTNNGTSWNDLPGQNAPLLRRTFLSTATAGKYFYRATVAEAGNINISNCRVASLPLTVNINPLPVPAIELSGLFCEGSTFTLTAHNGVSFAWTGPNNFSAGTSSPSINNAKPAHSGKYFVTVVNAEGCRQKDSVLVSIKAAPQVATSFNQGSICKGDSLLITASGGSVYNWSPPVGLSLTTSPTLYASPGDTTKYMVVITDASLCRDSTFVTVNVIDRPLANAGPDQVLLEGNAVQLNGVAMGTNITFSWSPNLFIDNPLSLTPTVKPAQHTTYVLKVTSNSGCGSSADSVTVRVLKSLKIPNAFSPNGDGVNDTWNIAALSTYNNYQLQVFNRYGQVVFSTKNYTVPWNGTYNNKPLPQGTYYYLLDLREALLPKLSGYVMVLR